MSLTHRDVATVGIGGPVGSGKTSLLTALVPELRDQGLDVGVIANDILTQEDADVLRERFAGVVPEDLVAGVETGACPHTGIREDPSMNLQQIDSFLADHPELDLVLVESGGDNLAATFNPELADYSLYVISVAEGEDIPRKRGPGVVDCDLLVVNKTDLAPHVGVDLDVMERDANEVRDGPVVFTNCKDETNIDEVLAHVRDGVLFA
ncbi:urease accessory protein UreG [Haloarcula argentinensis]|uniref:Urease accessory protein UreG n=1 Tax=Haloarcula argentinensis TaxID=43776 RepID=A0ABU2F458_HALAR|nr:urease accessory protein UreG [Haloarcula argentinensis]EMA26451.1 urease accessory protein UreG [Haloarcula argentinensis DSM 12282]MDS0255294.1 urease accessory protein UreG [Haloarcula argentinensis]